jgi:hypothetical protein
MYSFNKYYCILSLSQALRKAMDRDRDVWKMSWFPYNFAL